MRQSTRFTRLLGTSFGTSFAFLAMLAAPSAGVYAADDGLTHARAIVAQHRAQPVFTPPGPPFDARRCAAGKKQLSIPNISSNPFLKGIVEHEIAAGKEVGLTVQEWQNQGQPSEWVQGIEYARKNGFQIVDLISGIDPRVLEPQIKLAAQSGVKTMTSHFYDPTQPVDPLVAASLPVSFNTVGKILADWAIMRTEGKANVLIVKTAEVPPTEPLVRGIKDELHQYCPSCTVVQEINVGITEWATKIGPSVQAALLSNPGINFILPIYDTMTQFVVPAVHITGKDRSVRIASFNGTPFVLDYVREGKVDMVIGENTDWIARATVDGYLRALCGLKVPADIGVPFYIFDAGNAKDAGIPAKFDQGYGIDYVGGFRKAWMLQ